MHIGVSRDHCCNDSRLAHTIADGGKSMTQFIVSFRGLNQSDDQVVRVRSALEKAMRHECELLSVASDAGSEGGDKPHRTEAPRDYPGFPTVLPVGHHLRAV